MTRMDLRITVPEVEVAAMVRTQGGEPLQTSAPGWSRPEPGKRSVRPYTVEAERPDPWGCAAFPGSMELCCVPRTLAGAERREGPWRAWPRS